MNVRVVLVDDQDLVRAGFRVILDAQPDLEVVGEAADGEAAIRVAGEAHPDVVCMDVQMPGVDGLEATRRLVAGGDPPAVLVLTTFDHDDYLFRALRAGASGFLLKSSSPEQLVEAVRVVARGDALLAPAVTRRVIERFARESETGESRAGSSAPAGLTEREGEVLALVARGLSNAEIARELHLGEATVKSHVSSVLLKLGVRDRVQAVVAAYESGFVRPRG